MLTRIKFSTAFSALIFVAIVQWPLKIYIPNLPFQLLLSSSVIALCALSFLLKIQRSFFIFPKYRDPFVLLLLAYLIIGIFQMFNPQVHLVSSIMPIKGIRVFLLGFFGFFLAYRYLNNIEVINKFLKWYFAAGIIVAIIGLKHFVFGISASLEEYIAREMPHTIGRVQSTMGSPNPMAIYMVTMAFLSIYYFKQINQVLKKIAIIPLLIMFILVLLVSQMRAMYVSLVFGILFSILFEKNKLLKLIITAILIIGIFSVLINNIHLIDNKWINASLFKHRLVIMQNMGEKDGSFIERKSKNEIVLKKIFEFPFGLGMGFVSAKGSFDFSDASLSNDVKGGIDNYFIKTLVEMGFLGFFLFLALMISIGFIGIATIWMSKGTQYRNTAIVLFTCILSFIICSTTSNLFDDSFNSIYFWAFVGILLNIRQLCKMDKLSVILKASLSN
jgi:O-antigen ligase